jgi:hypothetical protein
MEETAEKIVHCDDIELCHLKDGRVALVWSVREGLGSRRSSVDSQGNTLVELTSQKSVSEKECKFSSMGIPLEVYQTIRKRCQIPEPHF